jgi:putative intracellular protease/amidase
VTDGNITTSKGPGTAMEFALELIRRLKGKDAAQTVRQGVLLG